mmetsp:Transcript_21806/g.64301  ORF Transcript_21806/g.64301 Transcript_21806/m.64301 type:complete len:241 (-) Transcript_21806:3227-3949(-)
MKLDHVKQGRRQARLLVAVVAVAPASRAAAEVHVPGNVPLDEIPLPYRYERVVPQRLDVPPIEFAGPRRQVVEDAVERGRYQIAPSLVHVFLPPDRFQAPLRRGDDLQQSRRQYGRRGARRAPQPTSVVPSGLLLQRGIDDGEAHADARRIVITRLRGANFLLHPIDDAERILPEARQELRRRVALVVPLVHPPGTHPVEEEIEAPLRTQSSVVGSPPRVVRDEFHDLWQGRIRPASQPP